MKTTLITPAGRLVIQPSATAASVQVSFFPTGPGAAPCGFLIPNASAGIAAQALEAVATINEESAPLPDPADLERRPEVRRLMSRAWNEGADAMEAAAIDVIRAKVPA